MYRPPCRIPQFPLHTPDDLHSRRRLIIIYGYFDPEQHKTVNAQAKEMVVQRWVSKESFTLMSIFVIIID